MQRWGNLTPFTRNCNETSRRERHYGNKFSDFSPKAGNFFFKTPGHTDFDVIYIKLVFQNWLQTLLKNLKFFFKILLNAIGSKNRLKVKLCTILSISLAAKLIAWLSLSIPFAIVSQS